MKTRILLAAALAMPLALAAFALPASAALLTQQLDVGDSNADVTSLQTFLAMNSTIYPEGLVTGFYGPLTEAAVERFQTANGIDPVGRVGPITLAAINAQMGGVSTTPSSTTEGAGKVTNYGSAQPTLSNITVSTSPNTAVITWTSSVPATARVMYSTTWPFSYVTAPSVTSTSTLSNAQSVTLTGLQTGTTYYYTVESLDPQGDFTWSQAGSSFVAQ